MAWCERQRVGYIFGLAGNKVLLRRVTAEAEQVALDRLDDAADQKVRRYAEFRYGAKTWNTERRVIARIEASGQGVDSRFIVTNLTVYIVRRGAARADHVLLAGQRNGQRSRAAPVEHASPRYRPQAADPP